MDGLHRRDAGASYLENTMYILIVNGAPIVLCERQEPLLEIQCAMWEQGQEARVLPKVVWEVLQRTDEVLARPRRQMSRIN